MKDHKNTTLGTMKNHKNTASFPVKGNKELSSDFFFPADVLLNSDDDDDNDSYDVTDTSTDNEIDHVTSDKEENIVFRLYTRRWFVLASYCLLSVSCGSNWLCFPAISNILRAYYDVSILQISMLSIVFGISLVIFSIPFAALLDKYGLAFVMKLSAFFNLAGAVIKYHGDGAVNGYWFLLCGNVFHALSATGFLFLPGDIASTWFGKHEAGKATSFCIAFDSLGTGLGFLLATTIIEKHEDEPALVRDEIQFFLLSQLIPAIFVFALVFVFVKRRPPTPPNIIELTLRREDIVRKHHILQYSIRKLVITQDVNQINAPPARQKQRLLLASLYKLLGNYDFQLIFHMQGIVASIEGLYELLLNEMLVDVFPGMERAIGILGFVAVMLGFTTNILVGTLLDHTGHYRKVSFAIFLSTSVLSTAWFIVMEYYHHFAAVSVVLSLLLSISTAYYTIAFAHSARVVGSITTSTSSIGVMLVLTSQVYDTIVSFAGTEVLEVFGTRAVNGMVIVLCLIATVMSLFVREKPSSAAGKKSSIVTPV